MVAKIPYGTEDEPFAEADHPDSERDPFRPPDEPVEVFCLHCNREYSSNLIEWREEEHKGEVHGFWCCPTPGCGGVGFGFDILPTDPDYSDERGGWTFCEEEDLEFSDEGGPA